MTRDERDAFGAQMRNLERAAHTAENSRRPDRDDIAESCRWAASRLTHYRDQEAAALRAPAVTVVPPDLVALVQEWQVAKHHVDALNEDGGGPSPEAFSAACAHIDEATTALLAWSPAPAPVAPPPVAGGDAMPGWPDANNAARWKPNDVVGHSTVRDADGSLRHEPLTREVADALWKTVEESRLRRSASMPHERAAIAVLFSAWLRLKELGWKEAEYCPKDGTPFDAIEPGSTGVHRCVYEGQWPDGRWWTSDEHDMYPSRPILWRRRQEGQ